MNASRPTGAARKDGHMPNDRYKTRAQKHFEIANPYAARAVEPPAGSPSAETATQAQLAIAFELWQLRAQLERDVNGR